MTAKPDPEIMAAIAEIPIIDCHEHLPEESTLVSEHADFGCLFSGYAGSDLNVAGMPEEQIKKLTTEPMDPQEKWRMFEPYYRKTRHTAYIRAVEIAIRDLYGIARLDEGTCVQVTERMQQARKEGFYRWLFKEKCGIEVSMVNCLDNWPFREKTDPEFFIQDLSIVKLLLWPPPVEELEKATGKSIRKFDDYRDAIEAVFDKYAPIAGAVKQQVAYHRVLQFDEVPEDEARRIFDSMTDPENVDPADRKKLQDWAFHHCARLCAEHDIVMKIHTGYKAGSNYMELQHIKPGPLDKVFVKHPGTRFDLFHIGYPYQEEVLAFAKHFTNVYVDMCWIWIIDPLAARRFLKQAIVAVPGHKVFGFGGDYGSQAELVYGHLRIALQQIGIALTEMVAEGWLTLSQAVEVARRILHDNPVECFRLPEKRQALRKAMAG